MKHTDHTARWTLLGAALVIAALFAYGSYRYSELRKERQQLLITITTLRESIAGLENSLSLTEYERDKISSALSRTEAQAQALQEETSELEATVDDFKKLWSLDPELLKKYSKVYFLNEHYEPKGLVTIDESLVNGVNRNLQIHENVAPFLHDMLTTAREEGLELLVTSAYRSFGTQANLKATYRVMYGAGTANQFSADQGYSEHQLGTTVDLTTKTMRDLAQSFDQTPEYKWLTEHAHRFGFVLSYPKGNKYYIYEPWHWRFVGVTLATTLYEEEKTLYEMDQRDIDEYLITIFEK
jgi:zinc D-Ala-D-Ala carboxypeptidase